MPFDPKRRDKVNEILGDPELYPQELYSWMLKKIGDNPQVQVTDVQLPSVEQLQLVGATGQPAFQNDWINYDAANWSEASFYKERGRVYLGGLVKNNTAARANTTIFTLPQGYRPQKRTLFDVEDSGGHGRVDVSALGQVIYVSGPSGAGVIGFLNLDNISFRQYS